MECVLWPAVKCAIRQKNRENEWLRTVNKVHTRQDEDEDETRRGETLNTWHGREQWVEAETRRISVGQFAHNHGKSITAAEQTTCSLLLRSWYFCYLLLLRCVVYVVVVMLIYSKWSVHAQLSCKRTVGRKNDHLLLLRQCYLIMLLVNSRQHC